MEQRLRRLEIRWRVSEPRDAGPPFDLARLSRAQRDELAALTAKAAPPTLLDPHGLRALSDHELERLVWLGSIGKGETVPEPQPEPSQVEQDRTATAHFYARALHPDGSFDLSRLTETQQQRLTFLEARLAEST